MKLRSVNQLKLVALFLFGLSIIAVAGFSYLTKSADMQSDANLSDQNFLLGKLAFSQTVFSFSGASEVVKTANSDGTGQITLTGFPPNATEPAWSPDTTRIAYATFPPGEIYVMNADGSDKTNLTSTITANERNPTWSTTGKIAYERDGQIWAMNATGTSQAVFSGISQPSPASPAWSADGSKLAFTSGGEVWVINANGTNERRVTMNATTDADPSWSPDGSKIIFTKGSTGIGIINSDGTNEANLTNGTDDRQPAWANDGTKIAYVRRGTTLNGIYVMDVTGANQIRIIADVQMTPGTENGNPVWQPVAQVPSTFSISGRITRVGASLSGAVVNLTGTMTAMTTTDMFGNYQFSSLPSGGNYTVTPVLLNHVFTPTNRTFNSLAGNQIADFTAAELCSTASCVTNGKIAFVRDSEIYTMNSDGSNQLNITNNASSETEPKYSPDGSRIVFVSNRDGNNEIYQMNSDGSGALRLTNNAASETSPAYSPDGLSIVFVSNRDGNSEIYKMNADGTSQMRLTTNTRSDLVPSYSPNGAKIIFVTEEPARAIYTMNSDGSNQLLLSSAPGFYNRPSYSPDGTKVIYVYGSDVFNQRIYTMNSNGTDPMVFPTGGQSGSYSPDGAKVVYECCYTLSTRGIYTANANGSSPVNLTPGPYVDDFPSWQPIRGLRRSSFDFDGDGKTDYAVVRDVGGTRNWYIQRSAFGFTESAFGSTGDQLVPGDYDGDLKWDVAVWRAGVFYIFKSSTSTVQITPFGAAGDDALITQDYDGDGKADPAVTRNVGGAITFYILRSTLGFTAVTFGTVGTDVSIRGDWDGDGKADVAVYRSAGGSPGTFYVLRSSDGGVQAATFGIFSIDWILPADFDGDGKTDYAVWRGFGAGTSGTWYWLQSSDGGFRALNFGVGGTDRPVMGDYDGDGRTDQAVWRPTAPSTFYVNRSMLGFTAFAFGSSSDIPPAFSLQAR